MNILFSTIRKKLGAAPPGLYVLFYTEMWEVFGRVGIISLLVLYLTKTLHFSDIQSFTIYGGFIALIFITPIFGGVICDRFLGNNHSIVLGGVIMVLGNLILVIPTPLMVYVGLATIAVGSGFFLPSITPLVGYLYDDNESGRDAGFTIYYLGKNLGYFLAPILCGMVAKYAGYNFAFLLSALGMVSGIISFLLGKKCLRDYKSQQKWFLERYKWFGLSPKFFIYLGAVVMVPLLSGVLYTGIDGYLLLVTSIGALVFLLAMILKYSIVERRRILAILIIMIFVVIFSSFLGEGGTVLNLFIDRIINRHVFNISVPTPLFFALDPLFMFLIGPFLAAFWVFMAKRKREPDVVSKFSLALFVLSLGFVTFLCAAYHATVFGRASPLYVILAYCLFPLAELCIMPIGLSMVTKLAPKNLNAMMVGVWMLASAISGYLTGEISMLGRIKFDITRLVDVRHASSIYMRSFAEVAIVLAVSAVILLMSRKFLLFLINTRSSK